MINENYNKNSKKSQQKGDARITGLQNDNSKMSHNTNTNINLNAIKSFEILSKTRITENPKQKQLGPI